MANILVFGCGYIGTRIARAERRAGNRVTCISRSAARIDALKAQGFSVQPCDLDKPVAHQPIAAGTDVDVLYYLVPPPPKGVIDSRSRQAITWLGTGFIRQLVLIGTTGVYGDCGGAWIDETQALNPGAARSVRRVDAENTWREWSLAHATALSILRVAGIYAADRLPIERIRQQTPVLAERESPFSNRIHADDLLKVCLAAAHGGAPGIYNVADDQPTSMSDYFFRVADALGLPRPAEVSLAQARKIFSPAMLSYLQESRRINNRKIKAELGVRLGYPTLLDGLTFNYS